MNLPALPLRFPSPACILLALLLGGCTSVYVTPRTIATSAKLQIEKDRATAHLTQAVKIANAFLASEQRRTLPPGTFELEEDGLTFVTADKRMPVRIKCSWAGDLLMPIGMRGQERSYGFVVGRVGPHEDRVIDNSLFKFRSGEWCGQPGTAVFILHEVTHQYYGHGTVSFGKSVAYYAEGLFLFRYRSHSKERLPFQTNAEFQQFMKTRPRPGTAQADEEGDDNGAVLAFHCRHCGPRIP